MSQTSGQNGAAVDASARLKSSNADAAACDRRLDQMYKEISPSGPYLPRLPPGSLRYNRPSPFWDKDTPFEPNEEPLQYLSFMQAELGSIFQHDGDWDDGNGGIARRQDGASRASSSQTPISSQQAPKKKISLADYNLQKSKSKTSKLAQQEKSSALSNSVPPKSETHSQQQRASDVSKQDSKQVVEPKPAVLNKKR